MFSFSAALLYEVTLDTNEIDSPVVIYYLISSACNESSQGGQKGVNQQIRC